MPSERDGLNAPKYFLGEFALSKLSMKNLRMLNLRGLEQPRYRAAVLAVPTLFSLAMPSIPRAGQRQAHPAGAGHLWWRFPRGADEGGPRRGDHHRDQASRRAAESCAIRSRPARWRFSAGSDSPRKFAIAGCRRNTAMTCPAVSQ